MSTGTPTADLEPEASETTTGLDRNLAAALAYLFGFITGLIFYVVEREDEFVRFHAAQSIVLFGGLVLLSMLLGVVSTALSVLLFTSSSAAVVMFGLFGIVWSLLGLLSFVLWIGMMVLAFQGKRTRLPIVGSIAERMVA